ETSWINPAARYDEAVLRFAQALLDPARAAPFLDDFTRFQTRVAAFGVLNSLAQLVIKVTAPGVPDFYQGTELWDLSLVDPDNRRPVDYEERRGVLAALTSCATPDSQCASELLEHRADGRVKMFVTARALAARAGWRNVYERGEYVPLEVAGGRRDCLFAFGRVATSATPRRAV